MVRTKLQYPESQVKSVSDPGGHWLTCETSSGQYVAGGPPPMRKTRPSALTSSESKYGDFNAISWKLPVPDGRGGASLLFVQLRGHDCQSGRQVRERRVLYVRTSRQSGGSSPRRKARLAGHSQWGKACCQCSKCTAKSREFSGILDSNSSERSHLRSNVECVSARLKLFRGYKCNY